MLNLPEPSIDAPCPPDYSSYDEIAEDFASGKYEKHIIMSKTCNNTLENQHYEKRYTFEKTLKREVFYWN